jgi:hypothetical protein
MCPSCEWVSGGERMSRDLGEAWKARWEGGGKG